MNEEYLVQVKDLKKYFPVGGMGKGVRAAYDRFRRAGVRDAELKLYPGLRHEILNEDCRAQVYDDLWEWIERHNG